MNNQGKRANKKKNLKSPEKLKDIEVCDLNYREFKTGVPKNSKSYKKNQSWLVWLSGLSASL